MAMIRRPRPGGGRHPPPLAPTVSNFKPRAQWSNSGSSIFLYVNLPGFYGDQIEVKKDERTRTIQIHGQRPLSTQTKARFNETYRVPESCDMTNLSTSFSHGLLTIEFPAVVEGDKSKKSVQDQGKIVQRPNQEVSRGPVLSGSSLGPKKPLVEEKQVGTSREKAAPMANKEEPKTYKSVVEGKRVVLPTGNSPEKKGKERKTSPSSARKDRAKEEKVVEREEGVQMGQHKAVQKIKEEEARSRPTASGNLKAKVLAKEDKVTERKKGGDIGQKKSEQEEGITKKTTFVGGSLEPKVHAKAEEVYERKGDGLGQKKEEKHTKPSVVDEARRREKEIAATNQAKSELQVKEKVERIAPDFNGDVESKDNEKMVGDKVSEGQIQERVKLKTVEEPGDMKDNLEVAEPIKVDSSVPMKEESGEDKEKMVEKTSESETGPLLVEGQKKTEMDPPAVGGRRLDEEETQKYDISLVNVGAAALVIMGFGAYVFVPLVKMFY